MSAGLKFTGLLIAGLLCLPGMGRADTQTTPHRVHKAKKQQPPPLPPPLPSGPQGPVPQVPLDAIPAVAPQVSFQDGLLTIVAPNSTLATFCVACASTLQPTSKSRPPPVSEW